MFCELPKILSSTSNFSSCQISHGKNNNKYENLNQ